VNLSARISRLETVTRQRQAQSCRWHSGVVVFPDSFPLGTTRQQARELCDSPGLYPGDHRLFIDIGDDDDEGVTPCG
jgi:hypothetical protein